MNQETRSRIIAEESAKFLDASFAQLDLSGFPDLNHPAQEVFATEDKYGLNRVVVSGSNQLRALADNPDREALHPSYFRSAENYQAIREYLDERDLPFIRENVATGYKALSPTGTLQVDPATPRPLTDHVRRAIALQAAAGDVEGADG
jgi:hypothetical protein